MDAEPGQTADEIKARLGALVDALFAQDAAAADQDLLQVLTKVQELHDRKRRMEGSKSDTRDLLAELLFTRMRRGMRTFLEGDDQSRQRAAEWVMGALFSTATLTEFAQAVDRVLLSSHGGAEEFSFAGRTDFISLEEVLQMLAAGKHQGCLGFEKADNRIDIYMKDGRIAFLDPHRMIRRVLPGSDALQHREIPEAAVTRAEAERAASGRPVLLALHDQGVLRVQELRECLRVFSKEVLFDFMRESEPYAFYYRRLDALPAFAVEHDLRLGVTSILLEGSKFVDDWRQLHAVFPDQDQPVDACDDMFARMGELQLGVLDIKLLGLLNGEMSPRRLAPALGLPLHEVYQVLVRLAREGVLEPAAGSQALADVTLSLQESMQEAFAALEANDDDRIRQDALDKVLGEQKPAKTAAPATGEPRPKSKAGPTSASNALDRLFGDESGKPAAKPDADAAETPRASASPRLNFLEKRAKRR